SDGIPPPGLGPVARAPGWWDDLPRWGVSDHRSDSGFFWPPLRMIPNKEWSAQAVGAGGSPAPGRADRRLACRYVLSVLTPKEGIMARAKPHATGKTKPGDTSERVGVVELEKRGVNVKDLLEKLIDAAGAEFTTYYYYTILRMYLAGHEDYKEI